MRDRWTDDRMDDLAGRVDAGFGQVHEDIAGLRTETHEDIAELRRDNKELRRDMAALNRDLRGEIRQLATREELHIGISTLRAETQQGFNALNHRFDALQRTLVAAVLTGFIGLIATHFS